MVICADQALKYWVLDVFRLPERFTAPVFGPLSLTMVWNKGVSFGVLNFDEGWTRWPLSAFSLIVACGLMVWAWRVDKLVLCCTTPGGAATVPMPAVTVQLFAEAATLAPPGSCSVIVDAIKDGKFTIVDPPPTPHWRALSVEGRTVLLYTPQPEVSGTCP